MKKQNKMKILTFQNQRLVENLLVKSGISSCYLDLGAELKKKNALAALLAMFYETENK